MIVDILPMRPEHVEGVVGLQRLCFPAPFPEELLWKVEHIERHIELFPLGQIVAVNGDNVVASASSTLISEKYWISHKSWMETVGGPLLEGFSPSGTTLYGLDISVHPQFRGLGIGRRLYRERFDLVSRLGLKRFGTACRLPGYAAFVGKYPGTTTDEYAAKVAFGDIVDQTMTPLVRYGLSYISVIHHYMEDQESGDSAALHSWAP
jgi:GNAT superfamily N-acetyltransferase